jgi:hypothetical protein
MTRRFRVGLLLAAGLLFAPLSSPALYAQCAGGGCASSAGGGCASCPSGGCAPGATGGCASCASGLPGCLTKCPPPFIHHYEGPPKLKYKKACPRPVCDPCNLEHYGYYQTCWAPWPFPPDWSHCPVPPPGAVLPPPAIPPYTPKAPRLPIGTETDDSLLPGPGKLPMTPPSKPAPDLPPPRPLGEKPSVRLLD